MSTIVSQPLRLPRFLRALLSSLLGSKPFSNAATQARSPGDAGVINERRGAAITVERIAQDFGDYPALREVSLDIRPGELVALLGPSGSGKTTLLRVIAGLNSPDRGRVLFNGVDATQLTVQERRVGFVFQNYALFKHMTVAENVAFGLKARPRRERPSREEIRARVDRLLEFVQLEGLGARFPSELSGGQRQRVALARALAIEPSVLLLDEPFGALDAKVRKDLRRWLREVHRETGLTTVFVTHDQDEAMELADRVVVLNQGRVEQVGAPEELYDHPASPFVISFVGEAIALPVTIADGEAAFRGRALHIDTHGLGNGPARVFFRPADIAVATTGDGELEGRVESLRRTPAGVRATIALDGYDQTLEIDQPLTQRATPGARIPLLLSNARIFPSEGASGEGSFNNAGDGI
jgi:sulfate/thiosulfate transport system ATP-binding protein